MAHRKTANVFSCRLCCQLIIQVIVEVIWCSQLLTCENKSFEEDILDSGGRFLLFPDVLLAKSLISDENNH